MFQGGPDPQNPKNPPAGQNPQNPFTNQNPQNPLPPQNPFLPNASQALEMPHMPPLNWSHLKPEHSAKPDKDAEAQLLRTNDGWTHTDSKTISRYRDFV